MQASRHGHGATIDNTVDKLAHVAAGDRGDEALAP